MKICQFFIRALKDLFSNVHFVKKLKTCHKCPIPETWRNRFLILFNKHFHRWESLKSCLRIRYNQLLIGRIVYLPFWSSELGFMVKRLALFGLSRSESIISSWTVSFRDSKGSNQSRPTNVSSKSNIINTFNFEKTQA